MGVEPRRSFDMLSPSWLFAANYFLMFGLTALDTFLGVEPSSYRLREHFIDYRGTSLTALAYVWGGLGLFVFGYNLRLGRKTARLLVEAFSMIRRHRFVKGSRFFLFSFLLFGFSFPFIVLAVLRFGAGRFEGIEAFDPSASGLYVAGEVSFIVYALGVWRFMLSKRPGVRKMPVGFGTFVWAGMFALQVALSVGLGSRTRLIAALLVAVLAYHYGYKRIGVRAVLLGGVLLIAVVLPTVALWRVPVDERPILDSVSSMTEWSWNSMMQRYSALEGFTVTFEHLDSAPQPDSLVVVLTSGLIPRLLWPDKPFSTWSERFSSWASDLPFSAGSPFLPSFPGELLLHFGYLGGLIAMMVLGVVWRTLFEYLMKSNSATFGFLYLVLLSQAVTQLEVGFVAPYGALLRDAVLGMLVLWVVTTSRASASATANGRSIPQPPAISPFRRVTDKG